MLFAPVRAVFVALGASAVIAIAAICAPAAAQKAFPYGAELRLDANPMKGSKRLPWLQFSENGTVDIDLWCASGRGRAAVVDRTITITPTALRDNQCSQAQLDADKEFLTKLMQVTAWRWEGFLLVLEGPEPLRWRPASN
ncbi:META domain-containing protein [Pseudorhodoplanes sp.]|uniref:META domain-containing protein n=1 Tax=Pseudorhodoplanes sp. TaxID=1934341 RepID=UPI002B946BCC|nr:META domain-containing protein [Pseudorhodoplanes sp.]HWV54925.1 META domain-containing protein [Pseudorhodoplanes sp.]